ncbi:hypothetical protein K440DRAFT_659686 [Wilcoxina mikolae CBS 423.85]|nr:hypothetical protein K440DRAFT_659686 [Wilcoxina mikolae CBS 423.85]
MALDRSSIAGLFWAVTPIFLFFSYHTPKKLWFLYFVLYLLLFFSAISFVPLGDNPASDYAFGTALYMGLINFNFFILSDPHEEHWWVSPPKQDSSEKSTPKAKPIKYKDLSLRDRARWCIENALCSRGIGWNWCIPHLPPGPPPNTSKIAFLRMTGPHLLKLYLLHDLSATILSSITSKGQISLWSVNLPKRALAVLAFGTSVITLMQFGYYILCTSGVLTGLFWTRIEDIISVMGKWSECFTLRRFGGRIWHQNFRRSLQVPSRYIAHNIIRAPKGSQLYRHTQSYVAFLLSGLYHYLAAKMVLPTQSFNNTLLFFFLQPNAFVLEDLLIWIGREKLGLRSQKWRFLGFVWTFGVLVVTAIGFVDDCVRNGIISTDPGFPLRVAGGVMTGEWIFWSS